MARSDETPRDLLFGLLALQVGLIDQDQLVSAFSTWTRAKGKTLAEILLDRGAIDAESRALLASMAEKQLKLHGGDTEKSLAAVAAGPSTREKLAALGDTDLTRSVAFVGSHTPTPDATATMSVGTSTSEGQRFRVLRPHAQGGLGAVFVALDGELNREVALKQILDHHADDPLSRTRFLIEAEITGGLEHPGIVPVYGLGHYGDGRPYYAMRFIRGDSLKEAIAGFHSDESLKKDPGKKSLALRKLLRRFVDVCNAIDYAHGRGVLHRDLKPGNVIVGKHGETLVVDWGLAKPMGKPEVGGNPDERTLMPSSSSGSAETLPGSAIGTPAYMSPEQASGNLEKLGPRSDVYSLGATLYCLLTGKAPFEGTELGTVLREVQKGAFPPPRQLDPTIDRALEVVCLKAMATKPEDRYSTARALADDIDRWAADEPISAWIEPFSVKARRWMKRNRTAVTAASAAMLMALVGLSAVLAVESRANEVLQTKNNELDKANRLKDEANANLVEANARVQARFELAREAILAFQNGVTEDEMLKGEELKGLRNKLLRLGAGFYEKLEKLLQGQTDRASRAILAQSYFELGELTRKIGVQSEALAVFKKALAIRRDLAAASSDDIPARLDLAQSLNAVGFLSEATGDNAGALAVLEEARALASPLADGRDAPDRALDLLGSSLDSIAALRQTTGNRAEAAEAFDHALEIRARLVERHPTDRKIRNQLASTYNGLGHFRLQIDQPAEAMEPFARALEIRDKLVAEYPADTALLSSLAGLHVNVGLAYARMRNNTEAMTSYRRALEIQNRLVEANPAMTNYRNSLGITYNNVAGEEARNNQMTDAMESYRRTLAIQSRLVEENPAVIEFRSRLSLTLTNVGELYARNGKTDEAIEYYRRGLAIRSRIIEDSPDNRWVRGRQAESHTMIGLLQAKTGRSADALESFQSALAIRQKLVKESPADAQFRRNLANSYKSIADLLKATDQPDQALKAYQSALLIHQKLSEEHPDSPDYASDLGGTLNNMAMIDLNAKRFEDARVRLREAVEWQRKALAANPRNPTYRRFLTNHWTNLLRAAQGLGDAEGVAEAERELAKLRDSDPAIVALDARLSAIIQGNQQPKDNPERLQLAQRAYDKALHATASKLWSDALSIDPKLAEDRKAGHRYNAACAAALAGCGQGKDEPAPDDQKKAKLREQARDWLQAELATWMKLVESAPPQARADIVKTLQYWKEDTDLAGIRDEAGLLQLPEAEQKAFRSLWAEVEALRIKAGGAK